ncbi:MAG TPA: DUF5925 domain-containing protein [Candidatus Limnocylindria bacterium]|nr:DUF5925 domain-containing protein [Candidatus Limnocylindria bacterium]
MTSVVFNRDTFDLPLLLFERSAIERKLANWRHVSWRTDANGFQRLPGIVFSHELHGEQLTVRFERKNAVGLAMLNRYGQVQLWLAATEEAVLDGVEQELREHLPVAPDQEEGLVAVRFWSLQAGDPSMLVRTINAPSWQEVSENYPAKVAAVLDRLMRLDHPPRGGQLMLWHGRTGTGKTHAIRALLSEWRSWARAEYIVDPEQFFGGPAGYLMSVLLGGDEDEPESEKWRLLVIEDTGELLSADAKDRAGQGLSRFLNTVDGLLGQGLRVLLLITTNEDFGKLHPAVTRPGRCAVNLRFTELERSEAAAWLERRGRPKPDGLGLTTLADLFALIDEREVPPELPPTIGFRSA